MLGGRLFPDFGSFSGGSNENIFALLLVDLMGILKHPVISKRQVLGLSVTDYHDKRCFLNKNNSIILFSLLSNAPVSTSYGKRISCKEE